MTRDEMRTWLQQANEIEYEGVLIPVSWFVDFLDGKQTSEREYVARIVEDVLADAC